METNNENQLAYSGKYRKPIKRLFKLSYWEDKLYSVLSDHVTGNNDVPLSWVPLSWTSKRFEDHGLTRVLSFLDDSSSIGIGYPDEWHVIIRRECFNKMIIWYIKQWAYNECFGLRRWVWFKLLNRIVNRRK